MFNHEVAIQTVINMANKTEKQCINKNYLALLIGCIAGVIVAPIALVMIPFIFKNKMFALKYMHYTISATMCTIITLPLIFISISKYGAISMWYANKAHMMFTNGKKLMLRDDDGELYEFDEDRYEAWLRQAIASK